MAKVADNPAIGTRFGGLVVVSEPLKRDGCRKWCVTCVCDCGATKVIRVSSLHNNSSKSCGCCSGRRPGKTRVPLVGDKFHYLTVCGDTVRTENNRVTLCKCECGREKWITTAILLAFRIKTCGCREVEEVEEKFKDHGESNTRLHDIWCDMRGRCKGTAGRASKWYHGRGLTVCPEWDDYTVFRDWAHCNGYESNLTIDRIDNDLGYSPGNCRWITHKDQMRNTSRNVFLEIYGERKIQADWANDPRCVVKSKTFLGRILKGWEPERALTTPTGPSANRRYSDGSHTRSSV